MAVGAIAFLIATYMAGRHLREDYKIRYDQELLLRNEAEHDAQLWKQTFVDRRAGFPSLMEAISGLLPNSKRIKL